MRILVIDDDPATTELIKLLLKPAASIIYTANSGMDGIGQVKKYAPDVVILDLMMPEMDGWQVCQSIREFSRLPILVLSALDNPDMVARALDSGADDYLIKPVASGVLAAHLNNLVRRAQTGMTIKTAPLSV
jgi:DNA-binding response OmpR family regulator